MSSSTDDEDIVQEVKITKITKHPKYVEGLAYFDIAVLIIEPIEFTVFVRPVCLPSSNNFNVDKYEGVSKIIKIVLSICPQLGIVPQDVDGNFLVIYITLEHCFIIFFSRVFSKSNRKGKGEQ